MRGVEMPLIQTPATALDISTALATITEFIGTSACVVTVPFHSALASGWMGELWTIMGSPEKRLISTSHVERSNLSLRMHNRRFTRLTNAHSKKFENHCHMIALYTVWYNYARINSAVKVAPAMAAGISKRLWEMADIVALIDAAAGPAKPRGSYKKRAA